MIQTIPITVAAGTGIRYAPVYEQYVSDLRRFPRKAFVPL
jgi:hypothetical protein